MNSRTFQTVIPTALALLLAAVAGMAKADDSVKSDTTTKTQVTTSLNNGGTTTYTINAGTTRGNYLFHSFAAFGLKTNEIAHFNNANSVHSIFGRVTGLSPSQIDGLIKANGAANLYLINPNGIVFGPNATIDIGGAFFASTANAVTFNDYSFSAATGNDVPELLTSDIAPGLQPGAAGSLLQNQGVLIVKEGKTLLLSSDRIEISGGSLTANGGNVQLQGSSSVSIAAGTVSALNSPTKNGSINIQGGAITIGAKSGRTILRAGNAAGLSPDETTASNFTLLDAGTASTGSPITLQGGENQAIQIFSGAALPNSPQGITSLRGATFVNAKAPTNSTNTVSQRIVVGGILSGTPASPTATSQTTTIGAGTYLKANNGGKIDVLSTGTTTSSGSLTADGGALNLKGSTLSVDGGALQANGGAISLDGATT
ncbi:MAG: filamentous hemagglutinin N-terminal domain-containing protein, partial [Cyanobium sp.]